MKNWEGSGSPVGDGMDIDNAFMRTFNLLLGNGEGEVSLEEFRGYLLQYSKPVSRRKSLVSGKDVALVTDDYCKDAKFISHDELREAAFEPLSINEIKDIDSILGAIEERIQYTGNKVLGQSRFVEDSDICIDSLYVRGSANVRQSKYVAYSRMIRDSEFVFGSSTSGKARHMIKTTSYNSTRCFESYYVANTSDTYFSYNCLDCAENMFSLNQRGSRYVIGNLKVEKNRYLELKKKLLSEVRERLIRERKFPTIFNLEWKKLEIPDMSPRERKDERNFGRIDDSFQITSKIMFGKELGPLGRFEEWLGRHTATVEIRKTPFGRETHPPFTSFPFMRDIDSSRFVTNEEAVELGSLKIDLGAGEELDFDGIRKRVERIAYFSPEIVVGACQNIIGSPLAENSMNIYKVVDANFAKNSALSGQVFNSEYIFGSYWMIDSRFCINCYHSAKLTNCFEMDGCLSCRDSMFCHNSENLDNCIFCFNTKSKRYAIGNVEVGREAYLVIKERIMGGLVGEIKRTGNCKHDIFNVGSRDKQL
ncbi:MAG: hypothetical protein ABIF01_04290 [Candidatus Micrarchaeota archaeon]